MISEFNQMGIVKKNFSIKYFLRTIFISLVELYLQKSCQEANIQFCNRINSNATSSYPYQITICRNILIQSTFLSLRKLPLLLNLVNLSTFNIFTALNHWGCPFLEDDKTLSLTTIDACISTVFQNLSSKSHAVALDGNNLETSLCILLQLVTTRIVGTTLRFSEYLKPSELFIF